MQIPLKNLTGQKRVEAAQKIRIEAAKLNAGTAIDHKANGDEDAYSGSYAMSFTKGLDHNVVTGLVESPSAFETFRDAIMGGDAEAFSAVPTAAEKGRKWEAPTAGYVFDMEGPDAQAVTMRAAPKLGSPELTYEMAEVYELAVLRDVEFSAFEGPLDAAATSGVSGSCNRLNALPYMLDGSEGRPRRSENDNGTLTPQFAFRGSSPGIEFGPYLSCFLLMGNVDQGGDDNTRVGLINYGANQVDQRVLTAKKDLNFMLTFFEWLSVQNGADRPGQPGDYATNRRPIRTPRDLATYVHFDALYQAYLNACLILLSQKGFGDGFAPFDPNFKLLSGEFPNAQAGGFALWGGPHILSLLTEVATRGLKAVRWQKFNIHRRLRPETLAGRLNRAAHIQKQFPTEGGLFTTMCSDLAPTIAALGTLADTAKPGQDDPALLPMAFREGSPMHPAYGAGHATVAGACVTMLKAFFDTSAVLRNVGGRISFVDPKIGGQDVEITVGAETSAELTVREAKKPLTLEGELNKLAANISIGRNMAGVHYFTDYYDSLRMGEEIAIGVLRDQALGYPINNFKVGLTTFDGKAVTIDRDGVH